MLPVVDPFDPTRKFVATAAHNLLEARSLDLPLVVMVSDNDVVPLRLLLLQYPGPHSSDLAVLEIVRVSDLEALPCAHPPLDPIERVIVRGSPAGLGTEMANLGGTFRGLEVVKTTGAQTIVVYLEEFLAPSRDSLGGVSQGWKGLSGGPIFIVSEGKLPYCIGAVARTEPTGQGARCYGTPLTSIAKDLASFGLSLELAAPFDLLLPSSIETFRELFSGLEDPDREKWAWEMASNLFFRGQLSADILGQLTTGSFLESIDRSFVEYFRGRLLLKKGQITAGRHALEIAVRNLEKRQHHAARRLRVLARARSLSAQPLHEGLRDRPTHLRTSLNAIEQLAGQTSDTYIRSEMASLLGFEGILLLDSPVLTETQTQGHIRFVVEFHESLLRAAPHELARQDVVNTAFRILLLLWQISTSEAPLAELVSLTTKGFGQSKLRRNSIFFCQMLFADGVSRFQYEQGITAVAHLLAAGYLLQKGSLTLSHEGIAPIARAASLMCPVALQLVQLGMSSSSIHGLGAMVHVSNIPEIQRIVLMEGFSRAAQFLSSAPEWARIFTADPLPHTL